MNNHETLENQQPEDLLNEQDAADALQVDEQPASFADLQTIQQDYEEQKDKYIRLLAEFENYKRRTVREKLDFMKTASQDILTAVLPVLDDFDRAQRNEPFSEGINLVYQKLYTILKNKGLEPIESNGQPFNADFHEAVTDIIAPTEEMKGKVIDTIEKGYMLGDKMIRYAKVVVGK